MHTLFRRLPLAACIAVLAATSLLATSAGAGSDPSFDGDGFMSFRIDGPAPVVFSGTTDAADRPLVVGVSDSTNFVARVTSTGTLDSSFGDGGIVTMPFETRAVVVDDANRPILAGGGSGVTKIMRLTENGTPDTTFGVGGTATVDVVPDESDRAWSVTLDGSGRIVAGVNTHSSRGFDLHVLRVTRNGEPDATFGTAGSVATGMKGQGDVRVLGTTVYAAGQLAGDLGVAAFEDDGEPIAAFGGGYGLARVDLGRREESVGLAVRPTGGLLVAGMSYRQMTPPAVSEREAVLVALDATGELDMSFGDEGVVAQADSWFFWDVLTQPDGSIVAAGGSPRVTAFLLSDGTPDPSFDGVGGVQSGGGLSVVAVAPRASGVDLIEFGQDGGATVAGVRRLIDTIPAASTPPVVSVPASMTVEATGAAGANTTFGATALDAQDGSLPTTCAPAGGSRFPLGATWVRCAATDHAGMTTTQAFTVTVRDRTAPTIATPASITAEATSDAGVAVAYGPVAAADLVDGPVGVACHPLSGSVFAVGTTTVACTASDSRGNEASESFTVIVASRPAAIEQRDTTAPTLEVPDDMVVEATSTRGAAVSFSVSARDGSDGVVGTTCTPASGSVLALGVVDVRCGARDAAGNTASATFRVRIVDTRAPMVRLPGTLRADATSPRGARLAVTASVFDAVDQAPTVNCRPSAARFAIGKTRVTCHASDAAGNRSQATTIVHVAGAREQLQRLSRILSDSRSRRLLAQIDLPLRADHPTCRKLDALVQASAGSPSTRRAAVLRLRAVIGCTR